MMSKFLDWLFPSRVIHRQWEAARVLDLSGWWTVHGTYWLKAYGFSISAEEYRRAQEKVQGGAACGMK